MKNSLSRKNLIFFGYIWCIGCLITIINPFDWLFFHLASAFFWQLIVIQILVSIRQVFIKKWYPLLIINIPLIVFIGILVQTIPDHSSSIATPEHKIRILQANLNFENSDVVQILETVKSTQPDIISFEEYNDPNHVSIESNLLETYPHQVSHARYDGFGLAIFSKFPIQESELTEVNNKYILSATLDINSKPIRIIAFHPANPISYDLRRQQRQEFEVLYDIIKDTADPTIVAGDFNAVPWYPSLRQLVEENELHYANKLFHWTFPSRYPLLAIPIDHILLTKNLNKQSTQILYIPGSDHRGLLSEVSF